MTETTQNIPPNAHEQYDAVSHDASNPLAVAQGVGNKALGGVGEYGSTGAEELGGLPSLYKAAHVVPDSRWTRELNSSSPSPDVRVFGPLIGSRVRDDGLVESCSVEDTVAIAATFAEQALPGENTHTPKIIEYAYPEITDAFGRREDLTQEERNKIVANNDRWLITIRDGHWPIPGKPTYNPQTGQKDGPLEFDKHDWGGNHSKFFGLEEKGMQDQMTEAADHGLSLRLNALTHPNEPLGPVVERVSILDGSWANQYAHWVPIDVGETHITYDDAIHMIDAISDKDALEEVMLNLVALPDDSSRMQYMRHYSGLASLPFTKVLARAEQIAPLVGSKREKDEWVENEMLQAAAVRESMQMILDISEFNTYHREGRVMTIEEQIETVQNHLDGLVRVANKISQPLAMS